MLPSVHEKYATDVHATEPAHVHFSSQCAALQANLLLPMSSDSDELRVLDEEPGRFAFLAWRNITIVVWLALPDSADIARLIRMGTSRAAESPEGLSDVHFVTRKVGLPDAETRSALTNAARSGSPHLGAVGVWLPETGFWASAVRSFVTGLSLLLRGAFEVRVFAELEALSEWLPGVHESRTGVAVARSQLLEMLRRAELRAETPAASRRPSVTN